MNRYMIYFPNGKVRLIRCDADTGTLSLNALQALVDGPIEVCSSCLDPTWAREPVDGIKLIVNEEGKWRRGDFYLNYTANHLYLYQDRDMLIGDALLCAAKGEDLIGFTKPVAQTICAEFGIALMEEEDTNED